jgi:hypothetical protein
LTLLTPQPGALEDPRDQSHGSSLNHPLADPFITLSLPSDPRVLSVLNILSGFELLTSYTTTEPSCEATANLLPSLEKAVEKDATGEAEE